MRRRAPGYDLVTEPVVVLRPPTLLPPERNLALAPLRSETLPETPSSPSPEASSCR